MKQEGSLMSSDLKVVDSETQNEATGSESKNEVEPKKKATNKNAAQKKTRCPDCGKKLYPEFFEEEK